MHDTMGMLAGGQVPGQAGTAASSSNSVLALQASDHALALITTQLQYIVAVQHYSSYSAALTQGVMPTTGQH